MRRGLTLLFGVLAYLLFLITVVYAVGWVGNFSLPRTIDSGPQAGTATALLIDSALLLLFAVQHSGMARPRFKDWWTRFVPVSIERSTYVLVASLTLWLVFLLWLPIPAVIWNVAGTPGGIVLWGLYGLGWAMVIFSTFLINHFHLFGLQQVWLRWRDRAQSPMEFRTPLLYRLVRHPLMLGFIIAFWATPTMTVGHLLFAVATTGYILVAIQLEERDLVREFGSVYQQYRQRVPMLIPVRSRRSDRHGVAEVSSIE